VAFGCARFGLKSAMITRVGNEQMGRFLVKTLADEGCDVSQIKVDPQRMTALAILGIKDRQTFPLLFYRDNCADMAFGPDDVDESFIADCLALHITGTHFSTPRVRSGSLRALEYAHAHNVRTVLDIDYRPVLWGLTTPGDGKTRYIPSPDVTASFQEVLCEFDLIVGTEEEFEIAGGTPDLILQTVLDGREGVMPEWGTEPSNHYLPRRKTHIKIHEDELERADNPLKVDRQLPRPAMNEPTLDDVTTW